MPIDVLIVGQGLAGSLLAWQLLREGLTVLVIDEGAQNASRVAAGLINPVTGQRLVKSAHVDELLPVAMACYRELAEVFGETFFLPLAMSRLLTTAQMRRLAELRLDDEAYQAYLDGISDRLEGWNSACGIVLQSQTGYLRTEALLSHLRDYFCERQAYRRVPLNHGDIRLQGLLSWQDIEPGHIVFCEGHRASRNPWFGCLPFQLAKGEILECQASPDMPADAIINYGDWWLPLGEGCFKLGATFEVEFSHAEATIDAKQRLLARLADVAPTLTPFEVIAHRAGIRPTTQDKQPFIGTHPHHPHLHVFNGFGAKGSLAIPAYARHFAAWLTRQTPLPTHCDIRRYHETHFPA